MPATARRRGATPNATCSAFRKVPTRARRELFSLSDRRPRRPHSHRPVDRGRSLSRAPPRPSAAPLRVLIVVDESDDPFAERIKAEVSALGFEVVAIEPWRTGESIESLDAVGRANQAAAAIRMIAVAQGRRGLDSEPADRPFADAPAHRRRARRVPNEGLVALQTAELLRTTLLSRSEVPPSAPPPAPRRGAAGDPAGDRDVAAGPAVCERAGGRRGAVQSRRRCLDAGVVQRQLRRRQAGRRRAGCQRAAATRARSAAQRARPASARGWSARRCSCATTGRRPGLYAIAAAGGALIRLDADATPTSPLVAHSASTTAAAVYVRADGGVEATRWLRVGVRAVAGAVPRACRCGSRGTRPLCGGVRSWRACCSSNCPW